MLKVKEIYSPLNSIGFAQILMVGKRRSHLARKSSENIALEKFGYTIDNIVARAKKLRG